MNKFHESFVRNIIVDYITDYFIWELSNCSNTIINNASGIVTLHFSKYFNQNDIAFDILLDAFRNPGVYFNKGQEIDKDLIDSVIDHFSDYLKEVLKDLNQEDSSILFAVANNMNNHLDKFKVVIKK